MTPIRKRAIAWVLAATAFAVASLAASFIYLRDQHLNDQTLVESKIQVVATERGFKLEEARKAGYSDSEIAKFLVTADRAEFDQLIAFTEMQDRPPDRRSCIATFQTHSRFRTSGSAAVLQCLDAGKFIHTMYG